MVLKSTYPIKPDICKNYLGSVFLKYYIVGLPGLPSEDAPAVAAVLVDILIDEDQLFKPNAG